MLNAIRSIIYVQISPQLLTLKNVRTGESIAEVPELAIRESPKPRVVAVGSLARAATPPVRIINPFAHPRTLIGDFTGGEQLLRHQIRRILGKPFLPLAPAVVLHPLGTFEGGLTELERRAFREMALGAGAAEMNLWIGRLLRDEEILARRPPQGSGEWE